MVHELKSRLNTGCVPVFSTVGLKHYFYALTAREWLTPEQDGKPIWTLLTDFAYAQVIKQLRHFRLVKVEQRMVWGLPHRICCSFENLWLEQHHQYILRRAG